MPDFGVVDRVNPDPTLLFGSGRVAAEGGPAANDQETPTVDMTFA